MKTNKVNWCNYCKELLFEEGYIFYKEKYYHLHCYHQIFNNLDEISDEDFYNKLDELF